MKVPEGLVKSSALTPTQVESLTTYLQVLSHEKTLKEAAETRSGGPVRIGSYYRTIHQGRRNIRSAVMTVVIATWMGFVKGDELKRLLEQAGRGLPDLQDKETNRVAALIEALVARIVM